MTGVRTARSNAHPLTRLLLYYVDVAEWQYAVLFYIITGRGAPETVPLPNRVRSSYWESNHDAPTDFTPTGTGQVDTDRVHVAMVSFLTCVAAIHSSLYLWLTGSPSLELAVIATIAFVVTALNTTRPTTAVED